MVAQGDAAILTSQDSLYRPPRWYRIALVLTLYVALGGIYLFTTPLFETPDEYTHYEYVRFVAENRSLPMLVTIVDERPQPERIPGVDRIVVGPYASALEGEHVPPGGYYLGATPAHEADYIVLRRIMASDWAPAYVGMLGSIS